MLAGRYLERPDICQSEPNFAIPSSVLSAQLPFLSPEEGNDQLQSRLTSETIGYTAVTKISTNQMLQLTGGLPLEVPKVHFLKPRGKIIKYVQ